MSVYSVYSICRAAVTQWPTAICHYCKRY